jgi:Zn finger protein HypA/HybF involved in hydrogenase expression
MDIQTEVQKIHHQFGVSEKANYEIQKLFDKAIKEAVTEALRIHDVVGRSEQLLCSCDNPNGFKEMEEGKEFCSQCQKPY